VLFKFPSTPHLFWLGDAKPRSDKVFSHEEASEFLKHHIQIEEKIDGANVGISFDSNGSLLVQNRGNYISKAEKGQFVKLWNWINEREDKLFDSLDDRLILFGEWCWAKHSIHYTELPDWFLAFDVFDKSNQIFWERRKRNVLFKALGLASVPLITEGIFARQSVESLLGKSRFYSGPMEGVYCRIDQGDHVHNRSKVVAPNFLQSIHEHWTRKPMIKNGKADEGDFHVS
jgi:hypothetical protein